VRRFSGESIHDFFTNIIFNLFLRVFRACTLNWNKFSLKRSFTFFSFFPFFCFDLSHIEPKKTAKNGKKFRCFNILKNRLFCYFECFDGYCFAIKFVLRHTRCGWIRSSKKINFTFAGCNNFFFFCFKYDFFFPVFSVPRSNKFFRVLVFHN